MTTRGAFNSTVAARTNVARQILQSSELLARYVAAGGLREDLTLLVAIGERAEALAVAQSEAQAQGGAATAAVRADFAALQAEYKAVMVIVKAARHTLLRSGADKDVLIALDKILRDESETTVRAVSGDAAATAPTSAEDGDAKAAAGGEAEVPTTKRKRVHRQSQEAIRAEIAKDAAVLLNLTGAQPELKRRKVDTKRLKKLVDAATALSGQLSERVVDKAQAKAATAAVHEAVAEQRQYWGACYGILRGVGREDARIADLLRIAARPR